MMRRLLRGLRAWLAWLNGDAAYAAYVAHLRRNHPHQPVPSRAEFYRAETERRARSIRRCC